jgi:hypothetical protein
MYFLGADVIFCRKSLLINEVHRKIPVARQKWPALMYNFLQSNKKKET